MQNTSSRSAHIGLGGYKLQFDTVFFQRCNLKCLNLCFSRLAHVWFDWSVDISCVHLMYRICTVYRHLWAMSSHVLAPNLVPETPAAHHEAQQLVDPESLSTVSRHWSHPASQGPRENSSFIFFVFCKFVKFVKFNYIELLCLIDIYI